MAKIINLIGKKFWKLTILEMLMERGNANQIKYKCICDCGKEHITSGESIRSGKSKSCGCSRLNPPNKNINRIDAIWKQLYKSTIEKRSKKINIKSDISFIDFKNISNKPCYYCGLIESNFASDRNSKGNKTSETIVKYNGIDRVDSNKGYTKDNSVPCCKYCNIAKNTMTKDEFLKWVKKIYEHNFR